MGTFRDLTKQRFGRLTVLYRGPSKNGATWECACACGKQLNVKAKHLMQGNVRSCGCLRADMNRTKFNNPVTREKHSLSLMAMWERRHARVTAANQKAARVKKLEKADQAEARPAERKSKKFSKTAAIDLAKAWK